MSYDNDPPSPLSNGHSTPGYSDPLWRGTLSSEELRFIYDLIDTAEHVLETHRGYMGLSTDMPGDPAINAALFNRLLNGNGNT